MDEIRNNEDKQKKQKLIALVLLPLSVGFCVWRLASGSTPAQGKSQPAAVQQQAAPERQIAVQAPMAPVRLVSVPVSRRDPFMPAIALETGQTAPRTVATPVNITEKPIPMLRLPNIPSLPPPVLHTFPATQPSIIRPTAPVQPVLAEPVMPYTLTGVVQGDPDVAILRHTDGSRRIVRTGDLLDDSYRMVAISDTTVIVAGNGDTFQLKLGGGS